MFSAVPSDRIKWNQNYLWVIACRNEIIWSSVPSNGYWFIEKLLYFYAGDEYFRSIGIDLYFCETWITKVAYVLLLRCGPNISSLTRELLGHLVTVSGVTAPGYVIRGGAKPQTGGGANNSKTRKKLQVAGWRKEKIILDTKRAERLGFYWRNYESWRQLSKRIWKCEISIKESALLESKIKWTVGTICRFGDYIP